MGKITIWLLYIVIIVTIIIFGMHFQAIKLVIILPFRKKSLVFKVIDQSRKMEEGVGIGVTTDVTSTFWKQIIKATSSDVSTIYMLQVKFDFT